MLKKNTPLKVVLIIFVTEILILVGLGFCMQMKIKGIHNSINIQEITSLEQVDLNLQNLQPVFFL